MDVQSFLDENRGPSLLATASVMIFLSTLFVGLRFYARYLTSTSFNVQDMAYIVTVDPAKIPEHFKGIMISEVLHPAAVAFPKLLVVLLYLHILTNRYERIAAKVLIALIFATWLAYTIAVMFQCMPFAFNWDKTIANGKCFDVQAYANSSSVPNIFTDLAVLVLPLRTVWGLKISIGRRVGLLFIFLTGSVYVFLPLNVSTRKTADQ